MKQKHIKLVVGVGIITLCFSACHVGRYFYWNFADIRDHRKFPAEPVERGNEVFHFYRTENQPELQLPPTFNPSGKYTGIDEFLQKNKTVVFLVIHRDTIVYERYFDGFDSASVIPSFSVSKAFVSALAGIGIDEGHIQSVHQPVTDFIPELLQSDSAFSKITLEHLLNMRSGIRFNEGYANPFADMAKYYYGRNLNKYITRLKIERPPDEQYNYISVNTLLLGMAIERSTGKKLNRYLSEKIWQPLGMQFDATWSVDSEKHRQIKAFCCINASALDFARFGRLYLNKGKWNGSQIVPEQWVETSTGIHNDSRDTKGYPYTYQWRVKRDGAFFAKGVLGQYIYVDPRNDIIIVRLGKKASEVIWPAFFEELVRTHF